MKSPFPQDWKEYTIGDCLRRVEHPVEVDSDALYTQIGIRSHGKGLFYKEPVTGELLGSKAVYWVEPNCFILNIVFAWEQAIGKTTQAEVGMIGSHRFPMYKPVNNLIDIDYLVYYLLTKRGTDILEAASPGGAGRNRTLGQDRFMKSRIVLPPLDEQQKIAKILSTQDKAIELQGRKIEELERFKKSCLEKMFPRKGQKVPEKRFPGFTDDWEQRKLIDEVTSIDTGKSKFTLQKSGVYEILGSTSVIGYDDSYDYEGDFLLTARVGANAGELYRHSGKVKISDNTVFIKGEQLDFVYYALLHFDIKRLSFGTGQPLVKASELKAQDIMMPVDSDERSAIGTYFSNLDHLITLHQRKLDEMKKQKKALMQLLLTGIVRVRL